MEVERERNPPLFKEEPNWGISALYNERQYILGGVRTKLFLPFDISKPSTGWVLHFSEGDEDICTFPLEGEVTIVGRQAICNVRFVNPSVSRQHCALVFRSSEPYLIDLNSKSGVCLNGEPILASRFVGLKDHDTIEFVDCLLQIRKIAV